MRGYGALRRGGGADPGGEGDRGDVRGVLALAARYTAAARHDPARRARRRVGLCRSPF